MSKDNYSMIAYHCPVCSERVYEKINAEKLLSNEFSGRQYVAKCRKCGQSHMTISVLPDQKIRLVVPCIACAHPHPFTIGSSSLLSKKLFTLQCSYSGMDICFIGEDEIVEETMDACREMLENLTEEYKGDDSKSITQIQNPDVMQEILYVIEDIALQGKIFCNCKNSPKLSVTIDYDNVKVSCSKCGGKVSIPAKTEFDASRANELYELHLS